MELSKDELEKLISSLEAASKVCTHTFITCTVVSWVSTHGCLNITCYFSLNLEMVDAFLHFGIKMYQSIRRLHQCAIIYKLHIEYYPVTLTDIDYPCMADSRAQGTGVPAGHDLHTNVCKMGVVQMYIGCTYYVLAFLAPYVIVAY